jgi:hypothetical protein
MKSSALALTLLSSCAAGIAAAQSLETETARLLPARWWKIGNAFELQTSAEGREAALPFAIEYGLGNNLELLVEPVPYTAIRHKVGRRATGFGDVEATLTYRYRQESRSVPALAAAFEVKFPTARDSLIGSRQTDYAGYLIASKRFGRLDAHANLAYTVVGKPAGVRLNNIFNFALAGVYRVDGRLDVFAEVLAATAAIPGGESGSGSAVVPEAAGGELVGTLGAGRHIGSGLLLYFAVSYDNNSAVLFRPGLTLRFR